METRALPIPAGAWCFRALGPGTLTPLQADAGGEMSAQFRYDSNELGIVAVKVRADSIDRINRCLQLHRIAADAGFPCARPVAGTDSLGPGLVVSAETWRPGGMMHVDGGRPFAARSAKLLADLTGILETQSPTGLGPPPPWMHWNSSTGRLWPPNPMVDEMDQDLVSDRVHATARAVAERLARAALPLVVGHGDWESQNLRWTDDHPWAVHDWDSLVALPEAAIVGAASGAFASTTIPTLAPIDWSEEFIGSYQLARGWSFTEDELEVAWAASLWPALHNARGESLSRSPPVALDALSRQGGERLHRAGVG